MRREDWRTIDLTLVGLLALVAIALAFYPDKSEYDCVSKDERGMCLVWERR